MKRILCLFMIALLPALSCRKLQQNQTYLECLIDGELFRACEGRGCIQATILRDSVLLLGGDRGFETISFGIFPNKKLTEGEYHLAFPPTDAIYSPSSSPFDNYVTDDQHVGKLTIHNIDRRNVRIYCSFEFVAYSEKTGRTVRITNGKIAAPYTRE